MDKKHSVEIRVVANGYQVMPPHEFNSAGYRSFGDMFVFNTFDQLSDWLRQRLEQPKEGMQTGIATASNPYKGPA